MASTSTDKLAAQIREHRRRAKMTQVQFAKVLNVSQQKLSDWENGRGLRAVIKAMRLAEVLGSRRR